MFTYRTLTTQQYVNAVVDVISKAEGHLSKVTDLKDGMSTIMGTRLNATTISPYGRLPELRSLPVSGQYYSRLIQQIQHKKP